jgi:hypothetical protein
VYRDDRILTRGTVDDFNFPAFYNEEFEIAFACSKECLSPLKYLEGREFAQGRDLCIVELGERNRIMI